MFRTLLLARNVQRRSIVMGLLAARDFSKTSAVCEQIPFLVADRNTTSKSTYEVYDHFNTPIHTVELIAVEDVPQICLDSHAGFQKWSKMPVQERAQLFRLLKKRFQEVQNEFIADCMQIGAPDFFAGFNYQISSSMIDSYCNHMSTLDSGVVPSNTTSSDTSSLAMVLRQPYGPVFSVSPWNAPLVLLTRAVLAPLLAGCSVVLKSSEQAAHVSHRLVQCFHEAGFPREVVQLVHIHPKEAGPITELFIANRLIQLSNFTGSTGVGRTIAELSGRYLKPCVLELGGKNNTIFADDVKDLDLLVHATWFSSMIHKGQICMCTDSLFVHESLYEATLEKLQAVASAAMTGEDGKAHQINQRNKSQAAKVRNLVDEAVSRGAEVVFQADFAHLEHENFVAPVILANVTKEMQIHDTESFGPVLTVHKYSSLDDLITEINASNEYGLSNAIWSSNHLRLIKVLKDLHCGCVHINGSSVKDEVWIPQGGVKSSGYGRFNAKWGIESFSYIKTITLEDQ